MDRTYGRRADARSRHDSMKESYVGNRPVQATCRGGGSALIEVSDGSGPHLPSFAPNRDRTTITQPKDWSARPPVPTPVRAAAAGI